MAAMALSAPAHWVQGAGARLGKAENNPAAVVGQERVTGGACHSDGSGFSGCHQSAVITFGLIISDHM